MNGFGLNIHHFEFEPAAYPIAAQAGAEWVRLVAWWRFVEPIRGRIDYRRHLEPSINAALDNGLKVLLCFATIPGWANGTSQSWGLMDKEGAVPPLSPIYFEEFASSIASHFGNKISAFEVWNEPNYKTFWNGDYNKFIQEILIPGAVALKLENPAAKIIGPCTDRNFGRFRQALTHACPYLDAVSCHLYRPNVASVYRDVDDNYLPYLHKQKKCNKPLWITEFSIDSWSKGDKFQADQYVAALEGVTKRPGVKRLFLFDWCDGTRGTNQTGGGLVTNHKEGLVKKPSFYAVQKVRML